MPIVRLIGLQPGLSQSLPPNSLTGLLADEGGMSDFEVQAAIKKLMKGKSVEIYFDFGENKAAKAFMAKVASFGLEAQLHDEGRQSWLGSPPRPWFIKYSFGVLVAFLIWFGLLLRRPQDLYSKVMAGVFLILLLTFLIIASNDRRQKTADQIEWEKNLETWWGLGLLLLVILIAAFISEPWLGIALLIIAVSGIGFAFIIRAINHNRWGWSGSALKRSKDFMMKPCEGNGRDIVPRASVCNTG